MALRVLLVDDQPAIAVGLGSAFAEKNIDLVEALDRTTNLIPRYKALKPSAAVLDLHLGGQPYGLEAVPQLRSAVPDARIVVYSETSNASTIAAAYKAGANAYVLKSSPLAELIAALNAVCGERKQYFPADVAQALAVLAISGDNSPRALLDPREFEVFLGLARGQTNEQIAGRLGLSLKTISTTRRNVFAKLKISVPAECVRLALLYDLLKA
jgi:two-component system invasion response regulator UvrY